MASDFKDVKKGHSTTAPKLSFVDKLFEEPSARRAREGRMTKADSGWVHLAESGVMDIPAPPAPKRGK